MWKPGQIITINSKIYRIKRTSYVFPCVFCECLHEGNICKVVCFQNVNLLIKLPSNCYLKLIRGKAESPTK